MIAAQRNDNRHFFYQWVIHAMVLLALGGFIAYSQYREFRRIDSQEQERLAVQAETVERNLAPQLALASRVLDSVLLEMPYWQAQQGGIANGNRQLRIINDALIGLRPIVMLDAHGKVSAASDAGLVGRDYASLASFQAARRDPGAGALRISAPGAGPISLYRPIQDAHGEFGGIVMVSLVPEYFSILLDSVRYAPDVRSAITYADGQVLLRAPAHAASAPMDMAARRLVSLRELKAGPPLAVVVGRERGMLFAPWRSSLYAYCMLFAVIAVLSTLGLLAIQRRRRAQALQRKKTEERIQQLAFFDQLTGLPNRILLLDRLKQAMAASQRSGTLGAVLFIDLDNFKTLNDTLGHDMGDLLLRQVAQRLSACVRAGDTVARLGGDEFVVMLTGLSTIEASAAAQVEHVGNKILSQLSQNYQLNQLSYRSTSSIGATLFRGRRASIDDLLKQADLAMYRSKAVGRNALRFFDPAMEVSMLERATLETDLREAIQSRQLLLHYQAQVDDRGRLTGAEALVRWRHPLRGLVAPAEFIPLAEETGLILPLGQWVLQTACRQLVAWAAQPAMRHLSVAVNVSVRLASSGCLAYQGYFFSRPLPRDEFEQYLLALPAHAQPEPA
jgi:diguanylate cyclase (GGDEF)-like protein